MDKENLSILKVEMDVEERMLLIE